MKSFKTLETTLNLGKTKELHILNGFPTGLGHWTLLNKNFWELALHSRKLESTFTADMRSNIILGINIQFNKSFSKTLRPTRRRICRKVQPGRKLDGLLRKVKNEIDQKKQQRLWAKAGRRNSLLPLKVVEVFFCFFFFFFGVRGFWLEVSVFLFSHVKRFL